MSGLMAEEVRKHVWLYWSIFAALLVLTAITVGVSYFHLPLHYAIILAMAVALAKGSLIVAQFMHLKNETSVIYWVLGFTVIFFVFVMVLPVVTMHESSGIPGMWSPAPAGLEPMAEHAHH